VRSVVAKRRFRLGAWLLAAAMVAVLPGLAAAPASAQVLRVGLAEDPDVLDPTLARTFVGRLVFSALCDKLFDIDEHLSIVPQLATAYEWSGDNKSLTIRLRHGVTFHDGEKFDATAAKYNLDRHFTLPGSSRRTEMGPITGVEVTSPDTIQIELASPFAPLLSVLADRAGMMVSPKAATVAGANFGTQPVCSGPFRFVERVAQDRIVLDRYSGYWDKGRIHFDRVVYLPIVDATVRLANLQSGQLDLIERVAASDTPAIERDSRFKLLKMVDIGYYGITINVGKSELSQKPLGRDPRVREALDLSLDREALVQIVMEGEAQPGNQWVAPSNPYYAKKFPVPKRDVAKARALLRDAGVPNPEVTLLTPTTADAQKLGQVVQAMAQEAGFDIKLLSAEFTTSLVMADKGQYEAYVLNWSGRADPDGNIQTRLACSGPTNYAGYCNPEADRLIQEARTTVDPAARAVLYEKLAARVLADRPIIYMYHRHWLTAYTARLSGLRAVPDGLVRIQDLKLN
jgi:peptide/nickel transport system substrate-binding protein